MLKIGNIGNTIAEIVGAVRLNGVTKSNTLVILGVF